MNYIATIATQIGAALDPRAIPNEPIDELLRSYAVLALALGTAVTAEDVHDAWVAWMLAKDPEHPSLIPFGELDSETAGEDEPFVSAIRSVARQGGLGRHHSVTTKS